MGHPSDTVDGSETPANPPVEVGSWTPIIYNGLGYISGGCLGFLNHQQYCWSSNDLLRIFVGGKIHIEYVQYINVYMYILMYLGGTPVIWNICKSQIGITSPSRGWNKICETTAYLEVSSHPHLHHHCPCISNSNALSGFSKSEPQNQKRPDFPLY